MSEVPWHRHELQPQKMKAIAATPTALSLIEALPGNIYLIQTRGSRVLSQRESRSDRWLNTPSSINQ